MSEETLLLKEINRDNTEQIVTAKRQKQIELTDSLIDLLFRGHKTFSVACKELGISRPRGYRLWNKWKESQEAQLVDTEWWDLYLTVKAENPEKALECLTRLKYRMITEKKEIAVKKVSITKQINEIIQISRELDAATSTG